MEAGLDGGWCRMAGAVFELVFGRNGNSLAHQGAGWSGAEPEFTWTDGRAAELLIPKPTDGDYTLLMQHGVFVRPELPAQRVSVTLGNRMLGHYSADRNGEYSLQVPRSVLQEAPDPMPLRFDLPNAARPCDHGNSRDSRTLALAFQSVALVAGERNDTSDFKSFVALTENLGWNCEFAGVQRALGVEPISLLRWSGGPTQGLISALHAEFLGVAEDVIGYPTPSGNEPARQHWWLVCRRYKMLFHTDSVVADTTLEQAAIKVRRRLRWLAGKLITDLREGNKVFIYSSAEFCEPGDGAELVAAVRGVGGTASLVIVGAGGFEPLRETGDGVWWARLPRLTMMERANTYDLAGWTALLRGMFEIAPRLLDRGG